MTPDYPRLEVAVPPAVLIALDASATLAYLAGSETVSAAATWIFDSCLAHASSPNLAPWPRNLIYLSYNRLDNAIQKPTRATHFANQDFTPLRANGVGALLS